MGTAGHSARQEYERRKRKDLERRHRGLKPRLAVVAAGPILAFVLIRTSATQLNLDGPIAAFIAGLAALGIGLGLASELWGARQSTEAWRKGAEGEEVTAKLLARLPAAYSVLHDLRMPGSRTNIDHLVIGPTGVFTVETKNYASVVEVRWGSATRAGRSMTKVVHQARGQAEAVSGVLGRPVRPIVCVHGQGVRTGLFSRPVVNGVHFCSGRCLVKALTSSRQTPSATTRTRSGTPTSRWMTSKPRPRPLSRRRPTGLNQAGCGSWGLDLAVRAAPASAGSGPNAPTPRRPGTRSSDRAAQSRLQVLAATGRCGLEQNLTFLKIQKSDLFG